MTTDRSDSARFYRSQALTRYTNSFTVIERLEAREVRPASSVAFLAAAFALSLDLFLARFSALAFARGALSQERGQD